MFGDGGGGVGEAGYVRGCGRSTLGHLWFGHGG